MKRAAVRHLRTEAEIDAVSSHVRLELIGCFRDGEASVAELARALGRSPHSLYHHVRKLVAAGILRETRKRRVGRRDEAVYDAVAERYEILYDTTSREGRDILTKTTGSILRQAQRDLAASIGARLIVREGPLTNTWTQRADARLTRAQVRAVRSHLEAITQIFAAGGSNRRGTPQSFAAALFPTPHEKRKS